MSQLPAQPGPGFQPLPVHPPSQPVPEPGPLPTPPTGPKRFGKLSSKPVIGLVALMAGLGIGSAAGSSSQSAATASLPGATVTVTAAASAQVDEPSEEPSEEPTAEPSDDPSEQAQTPAETTYKYGKAVGFVYEEIEISVKVESPKASANMFDKDNLEVKVTVCNKGDDTIDELSAEGIGLYAEDAKGGQYDLYGPYRSPGFRSTTTTARSSRPASAAPGGWRSRTAERPHESPPR